MGLSQTEIRELIVVAERAARAGGEVVLAAWDQPRAYRHKGSVDLVTETDLASEVAIREVLRETGLAILGEEGGAEGGSDETKGVMWIVDPIDGTTNFAHRVPHVGVSIGLAVDNEPVAGVLLDPPKNELFIAVDGVSTLNGRVLPRLEFVPMRDALLTTGYPYDRFTNPDNNTDLTEAFVMRTQCIRRFGAASLDLAWVAAGRLDGYWERGLKPWDVAAGLALLHGVGGEARDYRGERYTMGEPSLVAGHPEMVWAMLAVIAEVRGR
jgi:myo-inositol-1(or 4)-monophosphatase